MSIRIIKKYPNRRLYDTEQSCYITVTDVQKMIRRGVAIEIVDSETGNDITRVILVQIITEHETGASPTFTTDTLTQFIRMYEDAAQDMFGELLARHIQLFTEKQGFDAAEAGKKKRPPRK